MIEIDRQYQECYKKIGEIKRAYEKKQDRRMKFIFLMIVIWLIVEIVKP